MIISFHLSDIYIKYLLILLIILYVLLLDSVDPSMRLRQEYKERFVEQH